MIKFLVTIGGNPAELPTLEARIAITEDGTAANEIELLARTVIAIHLRTAMAEVKRALQEIAADTPGAEIVNKVHAADPLSAAVLNAVQPPPSGSMRPPRDPSRN